MYVYRQTGTDDDPLWTVGFYSPDGKWHAESDHASSEKAAKRVRWLNGGTSEPSREDWLLTRRIPTSGN